MPFDSAATPALAPLDRGLNVAILHIASRLFPTGFDVAAEAPETYEALCAHLEKGGRMLVWSGGSDATIYADAEVNHAFRAWHDWCHFTGGHDFSPEGEAAAMRMQQDHLRLLYGDSPEVRRWFAILEAEIVGQAAYYAMWGRFPEDQRAFVEDYLNTPEGGRIADAYPA